MFEWISQNSKVLTFFTNLGTLAIWLGYAQLLYMGFTRQRRPRVIINRGKKKDIDALCIISNMSAEAIFIEYILADLETSQGTITMDVTDFDQEYLEGDEEKKRHESNPINPVRESTRQGPLESGDFLHIGTFSQVIKRLAKDENIEMDGHRPKGDLEFKRLTIRIFSVYGPEDMPVGAKRSFSLQDNGNYCSLTPETWDTQRQSSLRQRRKLRKMMQKLNAQNFSSSSHFRHVENGQSEDEVTEQKDQEQARKDAAEASRE